jgi:hypothetical protein
MEYCTNESWSQQILLEDCMAVGANKTKLKKSRALAAVLRRLDLPALVRDFDTMMPSTLLRQHSNVPCNG